MRILKHESCAIGWWLPMLALGAFGCGSAPMDAQVAPAGTGGNTSVAAAGTTAINTPTGGSGGAVQPVSTPDAGSAMATGGGPAVAVKPASDPNAVTYHKDIRPIIEARCLGCHVQGGVGPFQLDTWEMVQAFKGPVVNAVKIRKMPPWLADDTNCTKTRDSQRLTDAQLALFTKWEADGYPEGDEADFAPLAGEPPPHDLGPANFVATADAFQLPANYENYVCKQVDKGVPQDMWVTAIEFVPEHREYVHHAIINIGGGNCDALGITAQNVYSFRPGSRGLVFEPGDAMLFPAGSVIAIQFHYNSNFPTAESPLPAADKGELRLWTLPAGEKPLRRVVRMPHHDMLINIPVDAVNQQEGGTQTLGSEYTQAGSEIIGISPHMHYLGQQFRERLRAADGTETCLVDIPDWDQSWQLDYIYEPSSFIKVSPGASVIQECIYSNRAEDQGKDPTGRSFTPQFTTYGEDTRNEMCLGYIWFRYPL